jgi:dihydrolipoamide dehydrogenase
MSDRPRIVIVGGGPGGYVAGIRAGQRGADVTVVERDLLGGTCLNWGCIPTKALLASAEALHKARSGDEYGFAVSGDIRPDLDRMMARKDAVVTQLRDGIGKLFQAHGVTLLSGTGRVAAPGRVEVEGSSGGTALDADAIILATGSEAFKPPFFDFSQTTVLTSKDVFGLTLVPSSLLIVGAGAIGCEFASFFQELGSEVTLVDIMPQVLPQEDTRLARQFQQVLRKRGIEVLVKTKVERVVEYAADQVTVELSGGRELTAEKMLVAVGRQPNSAGLGLEEVGVRTDERGYVTVDERLETNVPGIYAVGDLNGGLLLAHVASYEGLVAVENCLGGRVERDLRAVPNCAFSYPEIASVGLSETQARDEGFRPVTGTFRLGALGKALALGESAGYVQLIADADTDRVLGANMMGPHVTDVIHEVALAVRMGLTAKDLGDTVHAHPTIAEALMEAAHDLHGESVHVAG